MFSKDPAAEYKLGAIRRYSRAESDMYLGLYQDDLTKLTRVIKNKTGLLDGKDLIEWMEAICFPFSMDDYPAFFARKKNDRMKVKAFSQLRSRPKP